MSPASWGAWRVGTSVHVPVRTLPLSVPWILPLSQVYVPLTLDPLCISVIVVQPPLQLVSHVPDQAFADERADKAAGTTATLRAAKQTARPETNRCTAGLSVGSCTDLSASDPSLCGVALSRKSRKATCASARLGDQRT